MVKISDFDSDDSGSNPDSPSINYITEDKKTNDTTGG